METMHESAKWGSRVVLAAQCLQSRSNRLVRNMFRQTCVVGVIGTRPAQIAVLGGGNSGMSDTSPQLPLRVGG